MPIERYNPTIFKEIKVYTLKRLLNRNIKYGGTPSEAEEYRKIEGIIMSKNFNPFKLWERGVIAATDIEGAINELENAGLIEIDNNLLKLTSYGIKAAKEIQKITSLSKIDDKLFEKKSTDEQPKSTESPQVIEESEIKAEQKPTKEIQDIINKPISKPVSYQPKETSSELVFYQCPTCGKKLNEPKNFCPNCGEKIDFQVNIRCPNCGNVSDSSSVFCIRCGFKMK